MIHQNTNTLHLSYGILVVSGFALFFALFFIFPYILPLPLPCFLPSFSGQKRGQGQGQNLRAKYMGKWRRGQKYRFYLKKWEPKISLSETSLLSYFQWNVMEQNDHMRGQKISEIIENLYHIFYKQFILSLSGFFFHC